MSLKKEGKITFLKDVLDAKQILFGAFSDKLTKEIKTQKWKTIHEKAVALGLVPANKNYLYTRDTYWQNLKKYTMKKLDNKKQTGSGGGPEFKFTETDNIILDILGRDSPLVLGLPSTETWETKSSLEDQVGETKSSLVDEVEKQHGEDIMGDNVPCTLSATLSTTRPKKSIAKPSTSNEYENKEKKLKLSLEIMEQESYLKSLEILKMERELGLPPSKFTSHFPMQVIVVEAENKVVMSTEEN